MVAKLFVKVAFVIVAFIPVKVVLVIFPALRLVVVELVKVAPVPPIIKPPVKVKLTNCVAVPVVNN